MDLKCRMMLDEFYFALKVLNIESLFRIYIFHFYMNILKTIQDCRLKYKKILINAHTPIKNNVTSLSVYVFNYVIFRYKIIYL